MSAVNRTQGSRVNRLLDFDLSTEIRHAVAVSNLAYRVAHAAELDENKGFTGNALVREVEKKSAGRATYYKHYTGKDIHSLSNYHICLDVGEIGVAKCREIILDLVTKPE